jgi:hypothetical protein
VFIKKKKEIFHNGRGRRLLATSSPNIFINGTHPYEIKVGKKGFLSFFICGSVP